MAPPTDDHACGWREFAIELQNKLDHVTTEMAALKRQLLGPKSEKMPPLEREVRRGKKADPAETQRKRRERALAKEKLVATREELARTG